MSLNKILISQYIDRITSQYLKKDSKKDFEKDGLVKHNINIIMAGIRQNQIKLNDIVYKKDENGSILYIEYIKNIAISDDGFFYIIPKRRSMKYRK